MASSGFPVLFFIHLSTATLPIQHIPERASSCLICCTIDAINGVTSPKKVIGSMLTVPEPQLPTTQYCMQYVTQEVDLLVHQHPWRGLETYSEWEDGEGSLDHCTRVSTKILPKRYHNVFDSMAVMFVKYQDLQNADERTHSVQLTPHHPQRVQLSVTLTPT
ncbi:hypothetical protein B0H10DRAFT_1942743 [Mycena sp. CBHHK59/15]|nr:hypothetical protein B0H10DRAFT_1942743 [Mycena sp. CBHHK59/15]